MIYRKVEIEDGRSNTKKSYYDVEISGGLRGGGRSKSPWKNKKEAFNFDKLSRQRHLLTKNGEYFF